jgi:membrane protein DedA with SNARE-associated domain
MHLLRLVIWIAAAVLALTNWFMKEQWLGDFWKITMIAAAAAFLLLVVWSLKDWKKNRELAKKLESVSKGSTSERQ